MSNINKIKQEAEKVFGVNNIETSSKPPKAFSPKEHEAKDRSKIAMILVCCFLGGMLLILVGTPAYNAFVAPELRIDIFKLLATYSGTLGPFVGVIAGYYFKN